MSFFEKLSRRKHLDELVDLMNFKNVPIVLDRVEKGEYKLVWFDQEIPAKLPKAPALDGRSLTEYQDMFAYTEYLLNLWFDDFNQMMRSLGCKKQLVVDGTVRDELQTSLILVLCNEYGIDNPYRHQRPENLTNEQIAMITADRTAGIYFKRHGTEYVANIGGDPSFSMPFPVDIMEKGLGFDPVTKQCRASKADVAKLGERTVKYMSDAYTHVFEKRGIKNFALHPETKTYMARYIASVLCREYDITD